MLSIGCCGKIPSEIHDDVGNFLMRMLLGSGQIRNAAPNDEVVEYTSLIQSPIAMQDLFKKRWYSILDFYLRRGENTFILFRGSAVEAEELSVCVSPRAHCDYDVWHGDSGVEDMEENIKRVPCELQQSFATSSPSMELGATVRAWRKVGGSCARA